MNRQDCKKCISQNALSTCNDVVCDGPVCLCPLRCFWASCEIRALSQMSFCKCICDDVSWCIEATIGRLCIQWVVDVLTTSRCFWMIPKFQHTNYHHQTSLLNRFLIFISRAPFQFQDGPLEFTPIFQKPSGQLWNSGSLTYLYYHGRPSHIHIHYVSIDKVAGLIWDTFHHNFCPTE